MSLKTALAAQYRAGLWMLRQSIERCPDDLWASGEHPRTFWRIAYHAIFYTHLYLAPSNDTFTPWEKHQSQARILWDDDEEGLPPREVTYSQTELMEYADFVSRHVDEFLLQLDLDAPHCGFSWYKVSKLEHQFVNLRHLGIHIGQLQELLYARGIDLDWKSSA